MNSAMKVLESFWTVSGRMFVVLERNSGKLDINSRIVSNDGKEWEIIDNAVTVGSKHKELLKLVEEDRVFFFELNPIGHGSKPSIGEILTVKI